VSSNLATPTTCRCSFSVLWQSLQTASRRSSSSAHLWHTEEYLCPRFEEGMAVITSKQEGKDSPPLLMPFKGRP